MARTSSNKVAITVLYKILSIIQFETVCVGIQEVYGLAASLSRDMISYLTSCLRGEGQKWIAASKLVMKLAQYQRYQYNLQPEKLRVLPWCCF